jgi:hypothetical protein
MDAIKPVFKNLVSVDLLSRCLYGTTRNPNEGVNSVIWTRIPKRLETLKFGVYDAVICFISDDIANINDVLNTLIVRYRSKTVHALKKIDISRVSKPVTNFTWVFPTPN